MDETTNTIATAENGTAAVTQQSAQPTQADINNIVARESRKAVETLLRDAGITPDDNPEMQLKEYKKWLDSQKTTLEKATGDLAARTKERDDAVNAKSALEAQFLAVSKGIPASKSQQYIALANAYPEAEKDLGKALDAALKDFPLAPSGVPGAGNPPPAHTQTKGRPEGTVIF